MKHAPMTTRQAEASRRFEAVIAGTVDTLTVREAAMVSFRPESTIRRAITSGRLPARQEGRRWVIVPGDLTTYRRTPKPLSKRHQTMLDAIWPAIRQQPEPLRLAA